MEHRAGFFAAALLGDSHRQHVQGIAMARRQLQHLPVQLFGAGRIPSPVTVKRLGHQGLRVHADRAGFFTLSTISISSTTLFNVRSSFCISSTLILPSRS
ncbi:MAG TPA: hypothetical protein VHX18_03335 [Rhizomicrobium sp.]|nr:hypothetical protein [Rhizomicrobium sp.]